VQQPCSDALFEGVFEGAYGVFLHGGQHVGVGAQGNGYGGIPEHLGHYLGVDVAGEPLGGARVAQVVKACIGRKTGALRRG
jgi:hypothetical protein